MIFMKMFTFRLTRKKIILAVAVVALLMLLIVHLSGGKGDRPAEKNAGTNEQRIAFLKECGLEVAPEPIEYKETLIATELDESLKKYNDLQKQQGYNLEDYRGKMVTRYSYEVKNYPAGSGYVVANLLVYDGRVIGGDVSSTALDGFMHGLKGGPCGNPTCTCKNCPGESCKCGEHAASSAG